MRYLFLVLIISSLVFPPKDTLKIDSVIQANDTLSTNNNDVRSIFITNEISFLEKYEGLVGAFIGSLLAALIAIYSIHKTHKNQVNLENEKIKRNRYQSEKVYCGFLFSIHSILLNHQQFLGSLTKELEGILSNAKLTGKLAYDKPYTYLPVDLLKGNLNNILSYENYNSKNVQLLVTYLNFVENLYNDVNFISLIKLRDETKDETEYKQRVEYYFNNLFGRITTLNDMIEKLINAIIKEIEASETSNVFH